MVRKSKKLTATEIRNARPGLHGDGDGLWLQVREVESKEGTSLAKSWILRYTSPDGKPRYMGLGPLRKVPLAKARDRASEAYDLIYQGIDPIEARRRRRDEARSDTSGNMLFGAAVARFLEIHESTWKNEKHRQQWASTLKEYAASLKHRPVSAIDGALITETLTPIWTKKVETARRVKQRIERVVQWVTDGMPLPNQGASKRVRHHPAMPFAELPAFMAELEQRNSISARALEFTILTVARTGDTIGAKWKEIDLEAGVWTVSDGRHKTGKEFEIPLSKRALAILEDLPRENGGYVFPGSKAKAPLSNMAMLELLRGMRNDGLTVHGFRSTFRDWAGDRTNFARELIECAMSHQIKDKAEASYRRSTALEKRRQLMEAWSKYCASVPAASDARVVSLGGRR